MLVCPTQSVNRLPLFPSLLSSLPPVLPPSCPPSQGYLRAAKCYLMLGNPSLSIDFYMKVLHVQPHHKQAKEEVRRSAPRSANDHSKTAKSCKREF